MSCFCDKTCRICNTLDAQGALNTSLKPKRTKKYRLKAKPCNFFMFNDTLGYSFSTFHTCFLERHSSICSKLLCGESLERWEVEANHQEVLLILNRFLTDFSLHTNSPREVNFHKILHKNSPTFLKHFQCYAVSVHFLLKLFFFSR